MLVKLRGKTSREEMRISVKLMKNEFIFFDTNIYIDIFRGNLSKTEIFPLFQSAYFFAVNKIVLMELWSGAFTSEEKSSVTELAKSFPLLGIKDDNFVEVGKIMAKMRFNPQPIEPNTRRKLTCDILIALSAKENTGAFLNL